MRINNDKLIEELEKAGIVDAKQFVEKKIIPIMKKKKKNFYQALQEYRSPYKDDGDKFLLHIALAEIGDARIQKLLL